MRAGLFALLVCLSSLLLPMDATAQPEAFADADAVVEAEFGWGDRFRPERWTPAFVTAQADSPTPAVVEWYVPRPGREAMLIRQTVTLNPRAGTFPAYLPIGPDPAAVHVRVSDAATGRTLGYWPQTLPSPSAYTAAQVREPVFVGVSGEGPGLRFLDPAQFAVSFLAPNRLPRQAIGYDGLDILALNQPDLIAMEAAQEKAIVAWVRSGGRLLLWLGGVPLPQDSPITALLPGPLIARETLEIGSEQVRYVRLAGVEGDPHVSRTPFGRGEVLFLHVPPSIALQADTATVLLEPREVPAAPELPATARQETAEAVQELDIPWLPLLAVSLLIGPIDWLILRKTGRRTRRWLTLPGWIGAVAILIVLIPGPQQGNTIVVINPLPMADAPTDAPTDAPPIAATAALAVTGTTSIDETTTSFEPLHQNGPVHWKTMGSERTSGPLRDIPFRASESGVAPGGTTGRTPALIAEGSMIQRE